MKTCIKCYSYEDEVDFNDGRNVCKICQARDNKEWRHTIDGLITSMYNHQKSSSRKRGDDLPNYTLIEFSSWVKCQNHFEALYNDWKNNEFIKDKTPSADRLNDYKPYTFDNIRLVTWQVNNKKHKEDRLNGINKKASKSVEQYSLSNEYIATFDSTNEADRRTGVNQSSIRKCCVGTFKTAGGFIWKYPKQEIESLFYCGKDS